MIAPDAKLWIVSMDRRTVYAKREDAEAVAAIARRQAQRFSFGVIWTGAAYAISAKAGAEPVTDWIFDGEFSR